MEVLEAPEAASTGSAAQRLADEDLLELPRLNRHRLTVEEYGRLTDVGVLAPDARVELIDGEVIDMAPPGSRHFAAVLRLQRQIERVVLDEALVSIQSPLRLSEHNAPEPDLVVLKPRDNFYADALPAGADVLLVIEVSDSTLPYDVRVKAPLYARWGVVEYWVIDLQGQTLRRHLSPRQDGWGEITVLKNPGRIALPGLPAAEIDLSQLF